MYNYTPISENKCERRMNFDEKCGCVWTIRANPDIIIRMSKKEKSHRQTGKKNAQP
jgi:hypothetical protein